MTPRNTRQDQTNGEADMSSPELRRNELRSVIAMSVPMVVTTCCRMVMDITDYVMITRTHDPAAQAALLPAQIVIFTYIVMGMGTAHIVSTFASQALGRKRYAQCSAYTWQAVYLSILFGAAGLGLWAVLPTVLRWIGHPAEVQALELAYANVAVWSIGPTTAAVALSGFFNGVHHPRVTMWSAIEGIVINMVASYCLIFGLFGLPALGVAGAAWGTVIGTSYRALRLLVTMCVGRYRTRFESRRTWRIDRGMMGNILRVGGPQGGQWFSDVLVWALFVNVLIGTFFGQVHLIATNVAWQYLRLSFLPGVGMGMALTALVGNAIGQGDKDRAIRVTRISVALTLSYMGVLSVAYLLWRRPLIELFNADPQVVAIGSAVMICAAIFQLFDGLGITYESALRGAGDTFWPAVLFIVGHWLVVIGGGFVMVTFFPGLGSTGPWIAASALIIITGLLLWWRWHGRAWTKIDIFTKDSKAPSESAHADAGRQAPERVADVV